MVYNRKRKTFSCPGVLEGMGYQAECVVMGTREQIADQAPRLIRVNITREPAHMLDGFYGVRFGEELEMVEMVEMVERKGGLWMWHERPSRPSSSPKIRDG